jgi:hypothetical protein
MFAHGTMEAYTHQRCRCALCKAANAAKTRVRRQELRAEGLCTECGKLSPQRSRCFSCRVRRSQQWHRQHQGERHAAATYASA